MTKRKRTLRRAEQRNQRETARRLGISWRRAGMWIDHALLARWAAQAAP